MDSSSSDPRVLDSASKLKDLRLEGRNRHAKSTMDAMDIGLPMEVPDTPDRLVMMGRPLEKNDEDAERKIRSISRRGHLGRGTGIGSPSATDTERLFRQAKLASSISKTHVDELSTRTQGAKLGDEKGFLQSRQPSFYNGHTADRGKVNEGSKKLHTDIYPSGCGDNRRKMAHSELVDENENIRDVPLNATVSSTNGPCKVIGIGHSLELSDYGSGEETIFERKHCLKESLVESISCGSRAGLNCDLQGSSRKLDLRPLLSHAYSRTGSRSGTLHNESVSPNKTLKNLSLSVPRESISSYPRLGTCDKGKGVDLSNELQNKGDKMLLKRCQLDVPKRYNGTRKLVRNGCISPLNIEHNKKNETGITGRISSTPLHIVSPDSECRQENKMKEKELLNGSRLSEYQDANIQGSNRDLLVSGEGTTIEVDAISDIVHTSDDMGWRSTRNCSGKKVYSPQLSADGHGNDNAKEKKNYCSYIHPFLVVDSPEATVLSPRVTNTNEGPRSDSKLFEVDTVTSKYHGSPRLRKGKRKSNSGHNHSGECSKSAFDVSQVQNIQSIEPVGSSSIGTFSSPVDGITSGPVIDVDELPSPSLHRSSLKNGCYWVPEDTILRAQQVESDEILARQLQEQFFNESTTYGDEHEMDATMAWTLQHEENAQHASSLRNYGQPNSRTRQNPRRSSRNSVVQSASHSRVYSSARMARIWRNMRHEMDLEMRLNFLEALETAFDNDNSSRVNILQMQRDFNENDYEMLLSLDDDNHSHVGASLSQINSLPQSVIQTDNIEESCAICLETPTIGDTIRHLPCLHKFHKDCIDSWLKRRSSCPICKSGIT